MKRLLLISAVSLLGLSWVSLAQAITCEVSTSAPTFPTGTAMGADSCDTAGNKRMTIGTLLAGEDQTNNVLRVEFQFSRSVVTTDTLVKTGAGFIHRIVCWGSDAAATAGDIAVRDATSAGAGTIILDRLIPAAALTPANDELNVPFTTGLYIDYTTTADVTCTVSYR